MATGSDFAWPSVTVKRGSTVVKGRSIVKCSWSDNFGILLEKVGSEFSAEVVIQVVISKNEKLDTTHTVPLDAPVKLLETYGCLYVCYYLADNTVRETSQESPNALTMLMQRESQRVLPPVCQSPSSGSEQLRGDHLSSSHRCTICRFPSWILQRPAIFHLKLYMERSHLTMIGHHLHLPLMQNQHKWTVGISPC